MVVAICFQKRNQQTHSLWRMTHENIPRIRGTHLLVVEMQRNLPQNHGCRVPISAHARRMSETHKCRLLLEHMGRAAVIKAGIHWAVQGPTGFIVRGHRWFSNLDELRITWGGFISILKSRPSPKPQKSDFLGATTRCHGVVKVPHMISTCIQVWALVRTLGGPREPVQGMSNMEHGLTLRERIVGRSQWLTVHSLQRGAEGQAWHQPLIPEKYADTAQPRGSNWEVSRGAHGRAAVGTLVCFFLWSGGFWPHHILGNNFRLIENLWR